jgi:hypothetical protein
MSGVLWNGRPACAARRRNRSPVTSVLYASGALRFVFCHAPEVHMKRVTGIGGIFFKAKDPVALGAWYKRHLGIDVQDWGAPPFAGPMKPAIPSRVRPSGQ